jgi:polyphosphate kinase
MEKTSSADPKPLDGAISAYLENEAPKEIRKLLRSAGKHDILDEHYPYPREIDNDDYNEQYQACQLQLVRMQRWMRAEGKRIVLVFEGRDAAGKGGAIKAFTDNLNPRWTRIVALPAPSDVERGQWYFQRYIAELPTRGEMVLFDRSWYNRGVVEHVFGWCTHAERERFFRQVPAFEQMLAHEEIILVKIWLAISRAEQLRQFLQRENDPLKHWKLSSTDVEGLDRWDDYSRAIAETFERTHLADAPWTVFLGDDKHRARIAAMRLVLGRLDYPGRSLPDPDPKICGGPELLAPR